MNPDPSGQEHINEKRHENPTVENSIGNGSQPWHRP